jgi:hypothetical protein
MLLQLVSTLVSVSMHVPIANREKEGVTFVQNSVRFAKQSFFGTHPDASYRSVLLSLDSDEDGRGDSAP